MIIRCGETEKQLIYEYIGTDYPRCLYLYLDLKKYGFASDTVEVYIQRDGSFITAVLLKYYSCLHVYSKDNAFDADELSTFILKNKFTMVYCAESTACRLYDRLSGALGERAVLTTGWVAQIKAVDLIPRGLAALAQKHDFDQIVRMIYDDEDIGRSYRYDELAQQLEERNRQGYARNLVIKQDDLVIAHACTNAELDNIAVVAELWIISHRSRFWNCCCFTPFHAGIPMNWRIG